MSTPEIAPIAPPASPSLSAEVAKLAGHAIGKIEGLGMIGLTIGLGILLFKRGIEAILFQKNPLRPLLKSK